MPGPHILAPPILVGALTRTIAAMLAVWLCLSHPALAVADGGAGVQRATPEGTMLSPLLAAPGANAAVYASSGMKAEVERERYLAARAKMGPAWYRSRYFWASLVSVGVVAGSAVNSFTDHSTGGFHFTNEQWFGERTNAGGADKASHFVSFEIVARELSTFYQYLGFSPQASRLAGFGLSSFAGLVVEIGDGTNVYGFSYEDFVMDLLGASTATVLAFADAEDLIGFRVGRLPGDVPPHATKEGNGRDYSHEIYTGDLKLGGVARRLCFEPGPLRFLNLSVTYGTKGYPYATPDLQERQIGGELGLNLGEMLNALSIHRDTWWGILAHLGFDNFRFPYTAGGYQYDFNHHHWYGPSIGNSCRGCGN